MRIFALLTYFKIRSKKVYDRSDLSMTCLNPSSDISLHLHHHVWIKLITVLIWYIYNDDLFKIRYHSKNWPSGVATTQVFFPCTASFLVLTVLMHHQRSWLKLRHENLPQWEKLCSTVAEKTNKQLKTAKLDLILATIFKRLKVN